MPPRPRRNDRRLQSPPKRSPPLDLWSRGGFVVFWRCSYSSSFSTAMKASVGSCTVPRVRIFFLPAPQNLWILRGAPLGI